MRYRKLSECMTNEEVEILLGLLLPGSTVKELDRLNDSNCINVSYEFQGQEGILIFYPDDIDNIPEGTVLKNQKMYQVYMLINGYSSIWDQKMDSDMETIAWSKKVKDILGEHRTEQLKSDSVLQELLNSSEESKLDLQQNVNKEDFNKKLDKYFQIEKKLKKRLEHISYAVGVADALTILRVMVADADVPHIATELESLLMDYKNLRGLIEAFADGVMMQLGDEDVPRGIYAISSALDEKNEKFKKLFDQVLRNE